MQKVFTVNEKWEETVSFSFRDFPIMENSFLSGESGKL